MTWLASNATLVGLIFFFGFFSLVAVRTFAPGKKHHMEAHGRIPLEDGNE